VSDAPPTVAVPAPPEGICWKQKPTLRNWPQRYAKIEGKRLNVYDDASCAKKRGSSIADVTGCQLKKGTESWLLADDKPKLVLQREDLQGNGEASFCFEAEELRDRFFDALQNIADGRPWNQTIETIRFTTAGGSRELAPDAQVEWMWGDAGFAHTLAQMNPLRWTAGTVAAVAAEMRDLQSKEDPRPVEMRIKGRSQIHRKHSQADALKWLEELQKPQPRGFPFVEPEPEPEPDDGTRPVEPEPAPVDGTRPVEPAPEPAAVDVGVGGRSNLVGSWASSSSAGRSDTDELFHSFVGSEALDDALAEGVPPGSPADAVRKLVRSASGRDEFYDIKEVVTREFGFDVELAESEKNVSALQESLRSTQASGPAEIRSDDLDVTDADRRAGFTDWHVCPVDGSHIQHRYQERSPHLQPDLRASGTLGGTTVKREVFRAVWKRCMPVAIEPTESSDETFFGKLIHPHVLGCYGVLKERDQSGAVTNYVVTEYCSTSLEQFLSDDSKWTSLTPDVVDLQKYTILTHVSLGLQKLHDMAILHRNIKCGNILFDGDYTNLGHLERVSMWNWKISDFSEAVVLRNEAGHSDPAAKLSSDEDHDTFTPSVTIASPEMLDLHSPNIGLAADIYAFGIVTWEVMTRQRAWHWVGPGDTREEIAALVRKTKKRPKVPESVNRTATTIIQKALHQSPDERPKAADLTKWLDYSRREVMETIGAHGPVRERHRERLQRGGVSIVHNQKCSSCCHNGKSKCEHWSKGGRYSVHTTSYGLGTFDLTLIAEEGHEWMETALQTDYNSSDEEQEEQELRSSRSRISQTLVDDDPEPPPPPPLGIGFGKQWPKVAEIKANQMAAEFPDIRPGCTLLQINEQAVETAADMIDFKTAADMIKARPLKLRFSFADTWTDIRKPNQHTQRWLCEFSYVQVAAIVGGLKSLHGVRSHEEESLGLLERQQTVLPPTLQSSPEKSYRELQALLALLTGGDHLAESASESLLRTGSKVDTAVIRRLNEQIQGGLKAQDEDRESDSDDDSDSHAESDMRLDADRATVSLKEESQDRDNFLGTGATAVVVRGTYKFKGRPAKAVAYKIFHTDTLSEVIVREAMWGRGLSHENLVQIYGTVRKELEIMGSGIIRERHCLVMDIASHSLHAELTKDKDSNEISWSQRVSWMRDIASGMADLHDTHGIVHRDLKAKNVLLAVSDGDEHSIAKVSDYGLAKAMESEHSNPTGAAGSASTVPVGTFAWKAPETWEGHYSKHSDAFAFGVTGFEIASRCHPFPGEADNAIMYKLAKRFDPRDADTTQRIEAEKLSGKSEEEALQIVQRAWAANNPIADRRPDLSRVEQGCPPELLALIQRCWLDDPKARPACAICEDELLQLRDRVIKAESCINSPGAWDVMISYTQRNPEAGKLAERLYSSLTERGKTVWLDVHMKKLNEDAMREGVENSRGVIAIVTGPCVDPKNPSADPITNAYFKRDYCVNELKWARAAAVRIQPIVIGEEGKNSIGEFMQLAPPELSDLGAKYDFVEVHTSRPEYWDVGVGVIVGNLAI
jgi:serine/threonine protein kinase